MRRSLRTSLAAGMVVSGKALVSGSPIGSATVSSAASVRPATAVSPATSCTAAYDEVVERDTLAPAPGQTGIQPYSVGFVELWYNSECREVAASYGLNAGYACVGNGSPTAYCGAAWLSNPGTTTPISGTQCLGHSAGATGCKGGWINDATVTHSAKASVNSPAGNGDVGWRGGTADF